MKETINKRISAIAPSMTLGITARAKAMSAKGIKVFGFGAGEPDFDTPAHIKAAAAAALERGETKYSPAAGVAALCTAISEKLERENNLKYKPNQIVVSCGAKHSLFNVIMAICDEGDEVILPGPYWLSYPEMIRVSGARTVVLPTTEETGFKVTARQVEKAITPASKAIIINSPCNPTGVAYTGDELREIAEVAVRHGIFIISDEIYEKLIYDGIRHVSVGSVSGAVFKKTVTVNGFSKAYAMTGWRLGYCAGPAEVMKAVDAFQSHSTSAPCTFAQFGAVEALRGSQACVAEMVSAFSRRRDRLYQRMSAVPGVKCVKPTGAFYVLPNISSFGLDSVKLSERLLEEQGVAVIPGVSFGSDAHVRLSYACSMENIEGGMDRFEEFAAGL